MKTTVEIPDELFRRAKATAALQGRPLRELVEEGLRRVVESRGPDQSEEAHPTAHDLMKQYCGMFDSGVGDLSTNPRHMEGFGRDSMGHR